MLMYAKRREPNHLEYLWDETFMKSVHLINQRIMPDSLQAGRGRYVRKNAETFLNYGGIHPLDESDSNQHSIHLQGDGEFTAKSANQGYSG